MRNSDIIPNTRNLIFYNDAFLKIDFVTKTIKSFNIPIVYFDFDLLFSGYFESGQIKESPNLEIIRPNSKNLKSLLPSILEKISSQEILLILDSVNGLQSFLDNKNSTRFVNSLIMLLSANQKFSKSTLVITCMGQKKEESWILPIGRHILEFENMNKFSISKNNGKIEFKNI